MKICGIYKITNIIDGKKLVGLSSDIIRRWRHHKNRLRRDLHDNPHLQNAWNKYGEQNFKFEIILECPKEKLNEEEIRLIKEYNTINPILGYNLNTGGNRPTFSEETKQKMKQRWSNMSKEEQERLAIKKSNEMKGSGNPFYSKHHSEETKQKISQDKKGKHPTEESRRKMRVSQIGRKHSEETKQKMRNRVVTSEQKEKISNSKLGIPRSEETKQKIRETLLNRRLRTT